jgi:hypothetical protein
MAQACGEGIMTAPRRFPGWAVVWVAFIVAVFAWGVGFCGPAVFLQTLHAERGCTISTISAGITLHLLLSAAIVAYLPQLHRRFGIANTTFGGAVLSALGISAWANVREPWQIFLAALSSGAGWAVTSGAAIHARQHSPSGYSRRSGYSRISLLASRRSSELVARPLPSV